MITGQAAAEVSGRAELEAAGVWVGLTTGLGTWAGLDVMGAWEGTLEAGVDELRGGVAGEGEAAAGDAVAGAEAGAGVVGVESVGKYVNVVGSKAELGCDASPPMPTNGWWEEATGPPDTSCLAASPGVLIPGTDGDGDVGLTLLWGCGLPVSETLAPGEVGAVKAG